MSSVSTLTGCRTYALSSQNCDVSKRRWYGRLGQQPGTELHWDRLFQVWLWLSCAQTESGGAGRTKGLGARIGI